MSTLGEAMSRRTVTRRDHAGPDRQTVVERQCIATLHIQIVEAFPASTRHDEASIQIDFVDLGEVTVGDARCTSGGCEKAVLAVLVASGCSDKKFQTYQVKGKVSFSDGDPVKFGRVEFYHPEKDVSAYGSIGEDGSFVIGTETDVDGAIEGTHQVMVMQMIMSAEMGVVTDEPRDHGTHVAPKFSEFKTSGLTFEVAPNHKNFAELVVEKAKR